VSTRLATVGRRTFALSAICSAVLHGSSLGHVTNPVAAGFMVAMAAGCLYCAGELWWRGSSRSWTLVALMNLAMIGIHLPMSASHHHGASVALPAVAAGSTAMTLATVLAMSEVVVASAVLFHRTRGLAPVDSAAAR